MEIILEIILEGLASITKNIKFPLIVRLIIASAICGLIIAICILAGISALNATGIWGAIISWVISLGCIVLWIIWCVKILQSRKK